MNRYLIISDETIKQGLLNPKYSNHSHFDIIPAESVDLAIIKLLKRRPNIEHYTHLSLKEIESIYIAMLEKSDKQLNKKFKENTK